MNESKNDIMSVGNNCNIGFYIDIAKLSFYKTRRGFSELTAKGLLKLDKVVVF